MQFDVLLAFVLTCLVVELTPCPCMALLAVPGAIARPSHKSRCRPARPMAIPDDEFETQPLRARQRFRQGARCILAQPALRRPIALDGSADKIVGAGVSHVPHDGWRYIYKANETCWRFSCDSAAGDSTHVKNPNCSANPLHVL